jgi:hypothetical protein
MSCDWCLQGKCRSNDEATCDFKTLPMEKDAIIKRIEGEWVIVKQRFEVIKGLKDLSDGLQVATLVNEAKDKIQGITIMRQVCLEKFKVNHFPEKNMYSFMKLVMGVDRHMKRLYQLAQNKRISDVTKKS